MDFYFSIYVYNVLLEMIRPALAVLRIIHIRLKAFVK